jgi:hypothetical protein
LQRPAKIIFAITMERPQTVIPRHDIQLPRAYSYLIQRVQAPLIYHPVSAIVLVDGDGSQYGGLAKKFEHSLHIQMEGQSLSQALDSPYFVDSRITIGIQMTDMIAGVIRQYEEDELFRNRPTNAYLMAINRHYKVIEEKTTELSDPTNLFMWHGLHRMPERLHYFEPEEERETVENDNAEGGN